MRVQDKLSAAALAVLLGGMIVPAFAQNSGDTRRPPAQGMGQMEGPNRMDQGMTPDSGMSRRCAGMMQSMNGGTGRPNSQWHAHPPSGGATPD